MNRRWLNRIPYVSRSQRVGIFVLSLMIIFLQLSYFAFLNWEQSSWSEDVFDPAWMREQLVLDSLRTAEQKKTVLYPFNPNYLSDYRAYVLGMTVEEIDRLHAFRAMDQYVDSAEEFQQLTGVSNQWLDSISIYFKFPQSKYQNKRLSKKSSLVTEVEVLKDINTATQEDLMEVWGIGPVFSERIIRERNKFGGFVAMEQLDFIWGLSEESVANLKKNFVVLEGFEALKTNVNTASLIEISKMPYINYHIARSIVIYRSNNGDFNYLEEFENIKDFPLDKLEIISLYLAF